MKKYISLLVWCSLIFILVAIIVYLLLNRDTDLVVMPESPTANSETVLSYDQAKIYTCHNGDLVAAAFVTGDPTKIELSLSGRDPVLLSQVIAASGSKYSNDSGLVFWEHDGEVMVEEGSEIIYKDCKINVTQAEVSNSDNENTETSSSTAPALMLDKSFIWQKTVYKDGEMVSPNKAGEFKLTFATGNRFSAQTDCNNLGGQYVESKESGLVFSDMVMTLMACEGDIQEGDFSQMLSKVSNYRQDGLDLQLLLNNEEAVMYFVQE